MKTKFYAIEKWTGTIYVFPSKKYRDAYIRRTIAPEKEIREKITAQEAKKIIPIKQGHECVVSFLPWQLPLILNGEI
jgi:hypothetical protein